MKLSASQQRRFWREWAEACRVQQWSPPGAPASKSAEEITVERRALLRRAGFGSLTEVDRAAGFDRVLLELGELRDDVGELRENLPGHQVDLRSGKIAARLSDSPGTRARMLWLIRRETAALGAAYVETVVRERFGVVAGLRTVEDLSARDLHLLLVTLHDRSRQKCGPERVPAADVGSDDPF